MLNRDYYIARLKPSLNSVFFKNIVGMRGSGKSTLFSQIIEYLKNEELTDEEHIIYINLELLDNEKYRDAEILANYIKKKLTDNFQYFIFLDEVQYMLQFESLLLPLAKEFHNISFFISSSNSRLLPEDLNSSFYGNYKVFYITPFSYIETCKFLKTDPKNKNMLLNYLKYGGLPARFQFKKSSEVKRYLYSILDSIYLRDIVMHTGINDIDDLNYILKYLIKYIGTTITVADLQKTLIENNINIPEHRLDTEVDCLCKALIIRKCYRYDVHHEEILRGYKARYYIGDFGFSFIFNFDIQNNMEIALKNLIWLELRRRGYEVYTGINKDKEFDFVAIRNNKKMFIQVAYLLEDGSTINKEVEKLQGFDALAPRYLLSLDRDNFSRKGVIHKNIIDFILEGDEDIETDEEYQTWVAVE